MSFSDLLKNMKFPCRWDPDRICKKNEDCRSCEYQPSDDDKPNGKAAPVHIHWETVYDCTTPFCPSCGAVPDALDRCIFCGQKFLPDKTTEEWSKPPEEVRMDCFSCGGHDTLVGFRARCNGHFRGVCEKCGCRVIE